MSYILTYTGKKFDYKNISKEDIDLEDIFISLSRNNRFLGHSYRSYTVAEHSLYCYLMAYELGYSNREILLTLIHDFTEAYVGDLVAPLKKLLPEFSKIEKEVELAICDYLEIEPPTEEEHIKIKKVDLTMLAIEMRDLTNHNWEEFISDYTFMDYLEENHINKYEKNSSHNLVEALRETLTVTLEKYKKDIENGEN